VAGLGVRLFTDEHIFRQLARTLRDRGYDAESCQEAGRANRGLSDDEQLAYATGAGRAILTANARDFVRIDAEWKRTGRQHAGIVVTPESDDFGELLRRVVRHLDTYSPDIQHDTLIWLEPAPR
jgi:hypothetical protein